MADRLVAGLDWGGAFGRDPLAIVVAWRSGYPPSYTLLDEYVAKRAVPDEVIAWLRSRNVHDQPLARIWCGPDQAFGAEWLRSAHLPADIVPVKGRNWVEAGWTLIASCIRAGRLTMLRDACPGLRSEFRSFMVGPAGKYRGDDHLLDALRYLVVAEEQVREVDEEPLAPEDQASTVWIPGVGWVDNVKATHAKGRAETERIDPFLETWTDLPVDVDEEALRFAKKFCEFLGAPIPDFLKEVAERADWD